MLVCEIFVFYIERVPVIPFSPNLLGFGMTGMGSEDICFKLLLLIVMFCCLFWWTAVDENTAIITLRRFGKNWFDTETDLNNHDDL